MRRKLYVWSKKYCYKGKTVILTNNEVRMFYLILNYQPTIKRSTEITDLEYDTIKVHKHNLVKKLKEIDDKIDISLQDNHYICDKKVKIII